MSACLLVFALLHFAIGQNFIEPSASPWSIDSSYSYNAVQDQTVFTYTIATQENGKVFDFFAGIPSCPEIVVQGGQQYTSKFGFRGLNFNQDIVRGNRWSYTVVLKGLIGSDEIDYAVDGLKFQRKQQFHIKSRGRILGPKCNVIPKIKCDPGQARYVGECFGNTVRVPLVSHSKYYDRLVWSTDYPGCSFSQVDTITPQITFHGPVCDAEFRVKLEVWGSNHQYEVCYTTISSTDTTPPSFGGVYGPQDITVPCDDIPSPQHVVAKDECDNDVAVRFTENEQQVEYGDYTIRRTWVATDDCDNTATYVQNILVQDSADPKLVGVPDDETVSCQEEVSPCVVVATDNCDDVSVDFTEKIIEGTCVDSWKIVRKWIAEDLSHNSVTKHQTVTVVDNDEPVIVGVPADTTVSCDDVPPNVVAVATDNCQESVSVTHREHSVPGTCPSNYKIVRTFTATDECGNHVSRKWNVWVHDNEVPRLSDINTANLTVKCDNVPVPCVVEAVDNCAVYDVNIEPESTVIDGSCAGEYQLKYKWSVTDDCGNNDFKEQLIAVIDDEPPKFTLKVPEQLKAACKHYAAPLMSAVDNCGSASVDVSPPYKEKLGEYGVLCEHNYYLYREWVATDECGLTTSAYQTVHVQDTVPPVLIGVPPDMTLPCDADHDFLSVSVSAIDNCDCVNDVDGFRLKKYNNICPDTYSFINKWEVSDCCGHSTEHFQTVHIYDDVPPRLIGIPGSRYVSFELVNTLQAPAVIAEDNCDKLVTVLFEETDSPGSCEHNIIYYRRWEAVDECGNKASAVQTIRCNDLVPPEFSNPNYDSQFECPIPSVLPDIEVSDNVGGYLVTVQEDRVRLDGTCEDQYSIVRKARATDPCGNVALKEYTVHVWDSSPPDWLNGPCLSDQYTVIDTFQYYSGLCEDDVRAQDLCAGPIDVVLEEDTKLSSCENEYIVHKKWTATDNCGNSVHVTRTIDVRDLTPPTLINVPPNADLDCNDNFRTAYHNPTAEDYGYDGTLVVSLHLSVLSGQPCEYNYTALKCWTVHDCVGRSASECQTITVRDETPPTFTYVPPHKTVECDKIPAAKTVYAEDDCGHAYVRMSEDRESGTCDQSYQILRTYIAEDNCDLTSTYVQTITVVDETKPYFGKIPSGDILECGSYSRYVPASCSDVCDPNPEVTKGKHDSQGTCVDEKVLIRNWVCEDSCGNQETAYQTIRYRDDVPPKFNFHPQDLSLPCQKHEVIPERPMNIFATDNCDQNVDVTIDEYKKPGAYALISSENIRVWLATDNCGNSVEWQQTIIVYDDQPPRIGVFDSYVRDCTDPLQVPTYDWILDNCDTQPQADVRNFMAYDTCHNTGAIEFCWTPYDKKGNYGQERCMRISVDDPIPPVWGPLPDPHVTISYTEEYGPASLTATDNCDPEIQVTWTETVEKKECPLEKDIIYNYEATDICGNSIYYKNTISVIDDIPPPLTPQPPSKTVPCPDSINSAPVVVSHDNYAYEPYEVEFFQTAVTTSCQQERTVIREWVVRDCAFNIATWKQTIEVLDNVPPVLPEVDDLTWECEIEEYDNLQAWDECDQHVDVVYTTNKFDETDCMYKIARKWVATDDCGNYDVEYQTITVEDVSPPMVYGAPASVTVDNHNVPGFYNLTCSDNCRNDIYPAVFSSETIPGTCRHNWDIYRKWVCSDDCDLSNSYDQHVSVRDNEVPTLAYCPADITVQLGQVPERAQLTALDSQVYGDVEVHYNYTKEIAYAAEQLYTIFRHWWALDECGNRVDCYQTVNVIDTIPPIIPDVPRDIHLDCEDLLVTDLAVWNADYERISMLLTDSIADVGTVTITPPMEGPFPHWDETKVSGTCKNEYTLKRTWTATDHAGNSLSDSQVITVVDDQPPTFSSTKEPSVYEDCEHTLSETPEATDNCDEYLVVGVDEHKVKGLCVDSYTYIYGWDAVDACGNAVYMKQTIYVDDDEAPIVDPVPDDIELNCTRYLTMPPAMPVVGICSDNCYDGKYDGHYTESKHAHTCDDSWIFIRRWTCKDRCGHEVHDEQTITLVDYAPPTFIGDYLPAVTVECAENEPGLVNVEAEDDCSKYVEVSYEKIGHTIDYSRSYWIQQWTAVDVCGNRAEKERTIWVIDTTDPVIDIKLPDTVIPCDNYGAFQLPEPHCNDNCGASTLTRTVSTVDGTCEQEYDIIAHWVCTDQHDRTDEHSMTITVVDDEAPTMTVHNKEISVPCDDVPPAPHVNANDNCDDVSVTYTHDKTYPAYIAGQVAQPWDFSTFILPMSGMYYRTNYYPIKTYSFIRSRLKAGIYYWKKNNAISTLEMCIGWCRMKKNECAAAQLYEEKNGDRSCLIYKSDVACNIQHEAFKIPGSRGAITERSISDAKNVWAFKPKYVGNNCIVEPVEIHLCDNYELVRTWHAADDCGNSVEKTHTIHVSDITPPKFSNTPKDVTYDCLNTEYKELDGWDEPDAFESLSHGITTPSATDDCTPDVIITEEFQHTPGDCDSNSVSIIIWTATDDCGLTDVSVMTMTKLDNTNPTMSYVATDEDIECADPLPDPPVVTAEDDCNNVTVSIEQIIHGDTCNYLLTRIWTALDDCGNSELHNQVLYVTDTLPPVFKDIPEDETQDCDDTYLHNETNNLLDESLLHNIVAPTAEDECSETTVTETFRTTEIDCPQQYHMKFTWTAADECGNKATAVMILTKKDDTPPTLTGIPDDETCQCDTVWVDPGVEAHDNCGEARIKFHEEIVESDCATTGIFYTVYRTWTAYDLCGLTTVDRQTVLVEDGGPPTINTPGEVYIACKEDVPSYDANVDDDCAVDIEYGDRDVLSTSKTKTVKGTCQDEYDVITTYFAKDECGNTATGDHTVHIVDTVSPILTSLPDDTTIECDRIPDVANVGVRDDCAYVSPHFDETSTREGYCGSPYDIYRCWWVSDNCGHRDDHCQTITVQDTQDPQLLCAGAVECIHPQIECEIYPPLPPVTASDNCYEHIEIEYTTTSSPGTCDHDHQEYRMWTTDDCAGGTATMTQTVTYYDKTAPVLTGHTPDVTAECPNEVPVPQVTADDNCDYALTVDFTDYVHSLYNGCAGTKKVYRIWTATDICGNTDYITQTVTITDTIAPALTVYAHHAKVECHQVASSWPGDVAAEDDCDETVTVKFREEKEDGTCEDSYTLHRSWVATDCHGNEASHLQTVFVQDTIPPYFVGSPPEDTTIPQEEVYSGESSLPNPFNVKAEDNCADPIVDYNEVTIPLDYECDYMYYRVRTWSIKDDCGNTDVMQQTIEMVRTEIPDLEEPEDVTVECDSIPPPCDVQVLGEPGYDVTITFREETEPSTCDNEYTLIRTWIATDCALNSVTSTQRVHVEDSNPPVFTRYPEDTTIECGCEETGVAIIDAVDNCDLGGDEVDYTTTFTDLDCGVLETRTWSAQDECGNSVDHIQRITIEDTEDPLFCDDFCDEDTEDPYTNFECDQVPLIQDPLVKDDCDTNPDVTLIRNGVDINNDTECEEDKILVYEWEARDDCGNSATCARTINVFDDTPPLLVDNDQYCFPLTSYGPQLGEYAVYKDLELSMQFEDNCFGTIVTREMLSCNGTQHVVPHGSDYDDTYCHFAPNGNLYVKMEANVGEHGGRFYYVWFLVSDPCGNEDTVKRTIWVPASEFSYQDAVDRGDCPHGIGPIQSYVANLPRIL